MKEESFSNNNESIRKKIAQVHSGNAELAIDGNLAREIDAVSRIDKKVKSALRTRSTLLGVMTAAPPRLQNLVNFIGNDETEKAKPIIEFFKEHGLKFNEKVIGKLGDIWLNDKVKFAIATCHLSQEAGREMFKIEKTLAAVRRAQRRINAVISPRARAVLASGAVAAKEALKSGVVKKNLGLEL